MFSVLTNKTMALVHLKSPFSRLKGQDPFHFSPQSKPSPDYSSSLMEPFCDVSCPKYTGLSLSSLFCVTGRSCVLVRISCYLQKNAFIVVLLLFYNTDLAVCGSLFFQINFKLNFLNFSRNSTRISIEITLNT